MPLFAVTITWDSVSQLLVTGVINGAAYGLLGVGFALILGVSGRFHFAYSFTYALAAYGAFWASSRAGLPFGVAAVFGVLVCVLAGVTIERVGYRALAHQAGASALLAIFVASLGIGIAGENLLRLTFSSANQQLEGPDGLRTVVRWGPTAFRWVDVWQVLSAVVLVLGLTALLRYTVLGRSIKATRGNPELARIIGINPDTIYVICFAIGSLFAGVAAFWFGLKYSVAADMGFKPVIYAFVVGFLAGTARAPVRIFIVGVLLSVVEQLSSLWLETRWTQLVVFVILVVYLGSLSINWRRIAALIRNPAALWGRVRVDDDEEEEELWRSGTSTPASL
ncbi:MAG: branched-chain amino acid ABC transporter permease [Ilumatobacteraceae bacterium]